MPTFVISKIQQFSAVLWPSFIISGIANAIFFSLFDPQDLLFAADLEPLAVYSIGFFFLWSVTALTAISTCYYLKPCSLVDRPK